MKPFKLIVTSLAFASALAAQTITVAAAANMKYAVTDIAKAFTKDTGIDVKIITGASGKLTQQIMSGAPYDAFLSADVEYPAKLAQSGYTTTPSQVYAYGTLILWSDTGVDLSKGVAIVADPSVKKIAVANPKTAPYGIEAMNAMKYYQVADKTAGKIITAESISQVGAYVTTKAVDVGFMAKSIVLSPEMKNVGKWVEVDGKAYNPIDQAMVGLKNGSPENQIAAKKFLRFMGSAKSQSILRASGYNIPTTKSMSKEK
ncbi:molybdate ABC transporter substrate-binding protein [Sulfuricurvum sp. RIFCSPLOWO2_12_FULL_43_24]|uniref:molybdate ABC transporter substrate-binding protein n=1 Tax=Sulfuricurvum sp. RIFCSPLOWO2_12_FULL_43_24 TaxID=1802247 RepID=UPI0008B49BA6|nr:molybdate ABC transporter substrate-binding protein [Sulfuricurvum sp. RIFCSPLOWO2_12_FULL_43_24]OHD84157.1 MAG: molybdate ABC transporter substrate-binding protein [Sulfuricurvum sp. RIFCSPHIGHO2_02_FULL_43_9]OHD89339.1 MAG: molybdate ABC transporter substrate-binding protein [Sulfuricurvum sp. RIFCSPLOWO2_12_FULL_43_24]